VGGEDSPHGGGQLLVFVGDGDRHGNGPPLGSTDVKGAA
jgi:hypothetical protein